MKHEKTITLADFRKQLEGFPDDAEVFFGCPDEANPLELIGIERRKEKYVHIKFRLQVYEGRD